MPWPTMAEGVVLLAQITPESIAVDGVLDAVPQWVDVDGGQGATDERYGFRYRVMDADGELLMERSTVGPALVESFLEYWSAVSGVEILDAVPTLGRFPVVVPLLPGASAVDLEVRSALTGEYEQRGRWEYSSLDDVRIEPDPALQVEPQWLFGGGDGRNKLDLVILADGYREQDLPQFAEDAEQVKQRLLETEPFASYSDRLNIVRLDIPSAEAGASYDCPGCGIVDNAFGSIFALEIVNQLMGSNYSSRAIFQADQWRVAEAMAGVEWDAVLVLVNSQKFGGMAVHYAVVTRGVGDIGDTGVHELGHAFGMLGDEYVADDCIRSPRVGLPENIAEQPKNPPWEHLVSESVPLPTPEGEGYGVGSYQGAWNCPDLYRPEESCKMNNDGPFCEVCTELLTRRLLRFGDPAASVTIDDRTLVIADALPDTTVTVRIDGEIVAEGTAAAPPKLPKGRGALEVTLAHHSPLVSDDPDSDLEETWRFSR